MKKLILLFVLLFLIPIFSRAAVWIDTNTWDDLWEQKYSEWFEKDVNENFFTQGEYGGIKTDCADAAYFTRAIFAYENKLPFEFSNSLIDNRIVNNRTKSFDKYPEGLMRLKAFLRVVQDGVSTQSIHLDTYPVAINRSEIRPGIVINHKSRGLFGNVTHHVDMIKSVRDNGSIYFISSTLPADIRELTLTFTIKSQPEDDKYHRQGFRTWYWPQNRGKPIQQNPGYSLEQYTARLRSAGSDDSSSVRSLSDFKDFVKDKLSLEHQSHQDIEEQALTELCTQFKARVAIIKSGEKYRKRIGNRCMNAQEYDDYSTPTRDERLRILTSSYLTNFVGQNQSSFGSSNNFDIDSVRSKIDQFCPAQEVLPGQALSLSNFLKIMAKNPQSISANPNVTSAARWGLSFESSDCPEY